MCGHFVIIIIIISFFDGLLAFVASSFSINMLLTAFGPKEEEVVLYK